MSKFKALTDQKLKRKLWHVVLEPDVALNHAEYEGQCNGNRIEIGNMDMNWPNRDTLIMWFYEGLPQVGNIIKLDCEKNDLIIKALRDEKTIVIGIHHG